MSGSKRLRTGSFGERRGRCFRNAADDGGASAEVLERRFESGDGFGCVGGTEDMVGRVAQQRSLDCNDWVQ